MVKRFFRYDRNRFRGSLLLYINERVPCRVLQGQPNFTNIEILVLEIYQNNKKWLFLGLYKPPNQNGIEFLNRIRRILDYPKNMTMSPS